MLISASQVLFAEEWNQQESFETGDFSAFPWVQGGNADWSIDSEPSEGTYSARSGEINHNQTSSISTSINIGSLPGSIKFSFKTATEDIYDSLIFFQDGNLIASWVGNNEWQDTTFIVNTGNHTFKWEYAKYVDPNNCSGGEMSDCSGDGDCCLSNWMGDGLCDGTDQQWECDLICYENDGGDCSSDSSEIDAVWIDNIIFTGHNIVVDAGNDIIQILTHDGIAGAEIELDGTNTYPNSSSSLSQNIVLWFQSQMEWFYIDDVVNSIATGPNPELFFGCTMPSDGGISEFCIGEHDIVLKIEFGTFSQLDTVHVSISEPNQYPTIVAISNIDTVNIANENGIPGNPAFVNLLSQFMDQVEFNDPDILPDGTSDQLALYWSNEEETNLTPLQSLTDGDYEYTLKVVDAYGSSDSVDLFLTMIEVNEIPIVTISAVIETDVGLDQNVIEYEDVSLFGFVEDEDNDVDGSTSTTQDDVSYLWTCTHDDSPIIVLNENFINASYIAPEVSTNTNSETVICHLEATDPFQLLNEVSSTSETITITTYNNNQPPVINISPALKPSVNEDSVMELDLAELISNNYLIITDSDNDTEFTLELDDGDNYTLNNLIITPNPDYYGELYLPIRIDDGFIIDGEFYNNISETVTLVVEVVGMNDPPILEGTSNVATEEEVDVAITGMSVSDADIDGIIHDYNLKFDIYMLNGTISLYQIVGLNFISGDGEIDDTVSFTASVSNFNNAVSSITFHPMANYYGPGGEINFLVNDQGNFGIPNESDSEELTDEHTVFVSINAINDAPVITVPVNTFVDEDNQVTISGFFIEDEDVAEFDMEMELSVDNGVITLGDLTGIIFDYGDGIEDELVSFTGTKDQIMNAITTMIFIPNENYNGDATINAEINDLGAYGTGGYLSDEKSFTIAVTPINDSPEASDDSFLVEEGNELTGNLLLNDVDLDETNGFSPESHYTLSLNTSPITIVLNGSISLLSDGSFVYQPFLYFNGEDSFVYEVIDGEGGTSQATATITVTQINNAPELYFPSSRITDEDTEIVILGISVTDVDIEDNDMEMELSVEHGTLTLGSIEGLNFSLGDGESDQELIFSGTIESISDAISPITFIPAENYNGVVSIQVDVTDLGGTGSGGPLEAEGSLQITINAMNDDPIAIDDEGEVDEDEVLSGNVITNDDDIDESNGNSPESHYSLSINIIPINDVSHGNLSLISDGSYTYEPFPDYFGLDSFIYELIDGEGRTSQAIVNISVNSVNDSPILSLPTPKFTDEDTELAISGISVSDIDIADDEMKMDIYVEYSGISLSTVDGLTFIFGDGENDNQLSFTGIISDILNATATITFIPEEDYNGEVIVQVSIDDLEGNGNGGSLSDSNEFSVTIQGVNDAPEINSPGNQSDVEDNEFFIFGLSVDDLDAVESTNEVEITLECESGQISLFTTTGLSFIIGDGILDNEMIFIGEIDNINTALYGFSFQGNQNYNGDDTIRVNINDMGNTGIGGVLQSEVKMGIILNAINDPPVNQTIIGIESPPQITVSGIDITATTGNWNDIIDTDISGTVSNIIFSYQWQRATMEDGSDVVDILDENTNEYTITNLDSQKYIRVQVEATDDGVGIPSQQSTIAYSELYLVENTAPVVDNDSYNTDEDEILNVDVNDGVLIGDTDPDNDPITSEIVIPPQNGFITLNPNGAFVYTPNENYNGPDEFEYRVYDGALYGDINGIVQINIIPVNDGPTFIQGDNIETYEDQGEIEAFAWATDINDGDPEVVQTLIFILTASTPELFETQPSINPNTGSLIFKSFENSTGNSDVLVTLTDNGGDDNGGEFISDPIVFNINIEPINDRPSFEKGGDITVLEDSGQTEIIGWASEMEDGDEELTQSMYFEVVKNDNLFLFKTQPSIDGNGKLSFTVSENKNGSASVTIVLIDEGDSVAPNSNISEEKTFNIFVTPVNDVPQWTMGEDLEILEDAGIVTIDDFITLVDDGDDEESQVLTFNLIDLSNSSLFSLSPTVETIVSPNILLDGRLSFQTSEDGNGSSIVYFTLSDNGGTEFGGVNESDILFFELSVISVNDAPSFTLSNIGVQNEDLYELDSVNVIIDTPPNDEGGQFVVYSLSSNEAVNENGLTFASLSINSQTGNITILPIENGNGEATLIVYANDGNGTVNGGEEIYEQSFIFKVNPINDPPVNTILPEISGNPYIDSLLVVSSGEWNDDVDTLFSGASEITYEYTWQRADDLDGTEIQDILDANINDYLVTQDDFHKFLRVEIIARDHESRNYNDGEFTVAYSEYFEILNTPPVAVDDSYTLNEDSSIEIDFESGLLSGWNPGDECERNGDEYESDCDRDGDSLFVTLASDVSFGSLSLNFDGSFIYYPETNINEIYIDIINNIEIDQFTYTLFDGESSSTPARVSIVVNPVNDAPIFELVDDYNELLSIINVYEDYDTQTVNIIPGLIPIDEYNQIIQYSIEPVSISFADITINSETGEVTIISVIDKFGEAVFSITALDDGGTNLEGVDIYTQSFSLNVTSVNDAPSFAKGLDQPIFEDDGLHVIESWATDISKGPDDEVNQTLVFNISTDKDEMFFDFPSVDSLGKLTYQIGDNLNGDIKVTLSLKDDGMVDENDDGLDDYGGIDESEPQIFTISVQAINDAPSFNLGVDSALEMDEDGGEKSVPGWVTNISKGPADEVDQVLTFNLTSSENDATIFNEFPHFIFNDDSTISKIEYSVNPNFNGKAKFTVNLSDDGGKGNGGEDTSDNQEFDIWVHQINDKPENYIVYPRVFDYAKDNSTFFFEINTDGDTTEIYYRLPFQNFAPAMQPDSLLKFVWEKNDFLDVDTYPTLNFDSAYTLYYRLEASPSDNSITFVLRDNINYETYFDEESVFVEVDMTSLFPVYTGIFNPDSIYATENLDITGVTQYSWNVVAQNYTKDYNGNDPVREILSSQSLKFDLELPEAKMVFFQSELYTEYYDLYFVTNEETIDSVARVWIEFENYTQNLFPNKMDDSLYHITSTFINTGVVKYNFQVRDKRLNLGRSLDTVFYEVIIPELERFLISPDNFMQMHVPKNAVQYETPVIISAMEPNEILLKNNSIIISREYQILPHSLSLLKPARLSFSLTSGQNSEPWWKYKIVKITDLGWDELNTECVGESLNTSILTGGIYAVIYNSEAIEPLPKKFELGNIYPNPFNPSTTIEFAIPNVNKVTIDIFNIRGQHVLNLIDENISAGYHSIEWNGRDKRGGVLSSGIYFVSIKFSNQMMRKKVTFLK